jgi:cytochrome c-type biogenesis protein CcmH/NrfF
MFRRMAQGFVVCLLAVMMLGAGDANSRFNKVGHEMMCACGCGQILLECNHVSCPTSGPMIGELRQQISSGGTDTSILNWFAAKYGATVLAAPIRGGFDTVAWIVPLGLFVLATVGTAILIRVWKLRGMKQLPVAGGPGVVGVDAMRERIRRETEY